MRFSPILFAFVFHIGLILSCFVLCYLVNPILHCLTIILSYLLTAPRNSSHSLGPGLPARIMQAQSTLVAKRGYSLQVTTICMAVALAGAAAVLLCAH